VSVPVPEMERQTTRKKQDDSCSARSSHGSPPILEECGVGRFHAPPHALKFRDHRRNRKLNISCLSRCRNAILQGCSTSSAREA
jgi:hypothetical protein